MRDEKSVLPVPIFTSMTGNQHEKKHDIRCDCAGIVAIH